MCSGAATHQANTRRRATSTLHHYRTGPLTRHPSPHQPASPAPHPPQPRRRPGPRQSGLLKGRNCDIISIGSAKNLATRYHTQNLWDIQALDASLDLFWIAASSGRVCTGVPHKPW